jgi:hypothetical protein
VQVNYIGIQLPKASQQARGKSKSLPTDYRERASIYRVPDADISFCELVRKPQNGDVKPADFRYGLGQTPHTFKSPPADLETECVRWVTCTSSIMLGHLLACGSITWHALTGPCRERVPID